MNRGSLFLSAVLFLFPVQMAFAGPGTERLHLSPSELTRAVTERMYKIEEFQVLRKWGRENGIRIWGAGGTATGLVTYVKQGLENEALKKQGKPPRYFENRFGDNYFDVYRSTQDADIVIDGTEADAQKLEAFLRERFKYLQGSKEIWEVRLLNYSRGAGEGEKDPLLGFDFQNQNSDSYSTGMIEITDPPPGESKIRDLFDWANQKTPRYLQDLVNDTITFYKSSKHFLTKRAKKKINPEILSAIRALTKAFQYQAEIPPSALKEIKNIVDAWNPSEEVSSYVANQISKNGQKIFWHSPNVERAWNEAEDIGIRKKLIKFGQLHQKSDLTVWLSREPLRSKPLGRTGLTARDLGLEVVAHETNSFIAYENITRGLDGRPNVFLSRKNSAGEAASLGDGFYVKKGRSGARGTGLTIRFRVNPEAREGIDFISSPLGDGEVRFLNASALEVIDDSLTLKLTKSEYIRIMMNEEFTHADEGLLQRLRMKVHFPVFFEPSEYQEVFQVIQEAVRNGSGDVQRGMHELFQSVQFTPEFFEEYFNSFSDETFPSLVNIWFNQGSFFKDRLGDSFSLFDHQMRKRIEEAIQTVKGYFQFIKAGRFHSSIQDPFYFKLVYSLHQKFRTISPEEQKEIVEMIHAELVGIEDGASFQTISPTQYLAESWIDCLWDQGAPALLTPTEYVTFLGKVSGPPYHLSESMKVHYPNYSDWLEPVRDQIKKTASLSILAKITPKEPGKTWAQYPELIEAGFRSRLGDPGEHTELVPLVSPRMEGFWVLSRAEWANHPDLVRACGGAKPTEDCLFKFFSGGGTFRSPEEVAASIASAQKNLPRSNEATWAQTCVRYLKRAVGAL